MSHEKLQLGFWKGLKKPFFCLAPMADVTDAAFRRVIAKYGKPDVMWTEFVSAEGLMSAGREKLLIDFMYTEAEHPIIAQIFSGKPEKIEGAAKLCRDLGFDGVDINMGCPDTSIEKSGAGACLIKHPKLAQEIILAAKRGAGKLPVSVKTRIGYNKDETEEWIGPLLETHPACITIHARTRKEMSLVPAHWDAVARAVKLRDKISPETLIIANGGIMTREEGRKIAEETGCDGIMMGKAIFGNPWLFSDRAYDASMQEKLTVMLEHTKLFVELLGQAKSFAIMKKHYKAYVNGFDGAKELRMKLMEAAGYEEIEKLTKEFLEK